MFPKAINRQTGGVLAQVGACNFINDFYLVGGTALALHLGHRESVDLDFFSQERFDGATLKKELSRAGIFTVTSEDDTTLNGILNDVRVSFFHYDYNLTYPLISFEKIMLADARDIAAMKIDAVSSRGSKKDFVDIYFLMQEYGLPALINFFEEKYKDIKYNKLHILKSITYFIDADSEPDPIMIKQTKWGEIKKSIQEAVKGLL